MEVVPWLAVFFIGFQLGMLVSLWMKSISYYG
jgi:hypothetical protein